MSAELIRPFPKNRQRKTGEKVHGKSRIQTDTAENTEIENQRAQKVERKYSGKIFEKGIMQKNLSAV